MKLTKILDRYLKIVEYVRIEVSFQKGGIILSLCLIWNAHQ